jgi:chemotaxis protein methyltransferase CheR
LSLRAKIKPEEIAILGKFIKEKSGIVLDESKAYLFESRLTPLLKDLNCPDFNSLYYKVKSDYTGKLATTLIDAVCTNETSFFRDGSPFQLLVQKLVPDFYERNANGILKIWSAAASTGQEIYSTIMVLKDAGITPPQFKMKLLATDISDKAIAKASRGAYSKFELARGMDSSKLHKFFNEDENQWVVKDEIRAMVAFKKANLLNPLTLTALGRFDIIMCRNVAIYFSLEDKTKLFNCLATMLNPGGVLLIGSTESLRGVTDRFERKEFRRGIYYDKVV